MSLIRCFSAQEYPGDTSPWKFCIVDPKCRCGWLLAKARPVMGEHGVHEVEGVCKRHGAVVAETWDIFDNYPA